MGNVFFDTVDFVLIVSNNDTKIGQDLSDYSGIRSIGDVYIEKVDDFIIESYNNGIRCGLGSYILSESNFENNLDIFDCGNVISTDFINNAVAIYGYMNAQNVEYLSMTGSKAMELCIIY